MTDELDEALGMFTSQAEYRASGPKCPRCGHGNPNQSGEFREAYILYYKWDCFACEYSWQDVFELVQWEPRE